ncbi:MAG: histidine phosphatase family protein [Spirochaetales bacterium]
MQLLIVRHGKAVESHPDGDRFRALSPLGRERILTLLPRVQAKGFSAGVAMSSPYLRARQTAELFAAAIPASVSLESQSLTPDAYPADLVKELREWEAQGVTSAVVYSHNPFVSELTRWLLAEAFKDTVEFHTPSLWALDFATGLGPHQGRPLWVLHP